MMKDSIYIFDFDNTLIIPKAKIKINTHDNKEIWLSTTEYEKYKIHPQDKVDFSSFEETNLYEEIDFMLDKLINLTIKKEKMLILTARNTSNTIEDFLIKNKINANVVALGIPSGMNNGIFKSSYIKILLNKNPKINYLEFYDDREDCVTEVSKLKNIYADCDINVFKVIENCRLKKII